MPRVTVTAALAIVTVLSSLLIFASGSEVEAAIGAGFLPLRFQGVALPPEILAVPVWLTPLSATLVHGGVLHLIFNLVMLIFAGRETEKLLGAGPTLLLYVAGAYAAALAQFLPDPWSEVPMIGASGALSAFVGAYSLYYGRSRARAFGPIPAGVIHGLWLAVAWTGINYFVALALSEPGFQIAWAAHVGGFLAGLALARPLLKWRWRDV